MAKTDPAGREYPLTAYVFGFLGEPVQAIKKAWETCVLRAYGHEPQWVKGGKLSEESRASLATINLHFHDLRHEAGSRWLEAGMPLHHVKEILGHANISQTDTYLNAGRVALQESMKRFDATRCTPAAQKPGIEHRPVSRNLENVVPSVGDSTQGCGLCDMRDQRDKNFVSSAVYTCSMLASLDGQIGNPGERPSMHMSDSP